MRWTKAVWIQALALSIATLGGQVVQAAAMTTPGAAPGTPSWQSYFRTNSLDFPAVFRARHPGPGWLLQHRAALHLTPAQISADQRLVTGMVQAARTSVTALQATYAKYQADAGVTAPALSTITADVEAVGRAETRVGLAMVPYHLKAYALLTPTQKSIYQTLVATPATP
ncbi:hypothetical protein [Acidocella sp.]|jgi:Spy/CpxP family protein refolding chaperone|uniref:hypothetical protein n=1 Tax=Acidocella sp. TaxID=50710 RepID=UPI002F40E60B